MILVVELLREGPEHQAFNAGLLHALTKAYPNTPIQFHAESQHLEAVKELAASLPVEYHTLDIAPRHASLWQRLRTDVAITKRILAEHHHTSRIIFSSITIPMLWALKVCKAPKYQLGAVLHGGLAELRHVPRFNLVKRLTGLRTALLASPDFLTFWVLEQGIYDELTRILPHDTDRFAVFLHPLPPDLMYTEHQPSESPLKLGLLGLATPQKGLLVFLKLARDFHDKPIKFEITGRIHQDFKNKVSPELQYLSTLPSDRVMPREEFVAQLKQLSYAAFLFDGGHYSLTASGVMLDCIALGIPLIGRKHPHFDHLQQQVGEIGLFCEKGDENALIDNIITGVDEHRYREQSHAMRRLKQQRTPEALGERAKQLLYQRQ